MKLATWNVNSIRARRERTLAFLERHSPDVLCLQELKVTDEAFPREELVAAGYNVLTHGQKTYNGVAILARTALEDPLAGLDDGVDDAQARLVAASTMGVRIVSAYFPNGSSPDSDKYAYKLAWMSRLRAYLETRHRPDEPLVLCGDFNVAVDDLDIARPDQWRDTVLTTEAVRGALRRIAEWGLVDVVRRHHPAGGPHTWWDYRQLAFPKGNGLRIDHVFASATLADSCSAAFVDRDERKGQSPSDHAPVLAVFDV